MSGDLSDKLVEIILLAFGSGIIAEILPSSETERMTNSEAATSPRTIKSRGRAFVCVCRNSVQEVMVVKPGVPDLRQVAPCPGLGSSYVITW